MSASAAPVRCLSCDKPVERFVVEGVAYLGQYTSLNQPCGCLDAGILFDFAARDGLQ